MNSPAPVIDHTLLKPLTTPGEIDHLCEEAVEYGFAAVCVPPSLVRRAAERLYGSEVGVATVIGFPLGYESTACKLFAAREALAAGAGELDMVINQGLFRAGDEAAVESEIRQIVQAAHGQPVKVIIEACHLDAGQKRRLVEIIAAAGAAYVKTSTGFAASGATPEDVRLLAEASAGRLKVKASGGIRDLEGCRSMLAAGASRIGTSSGVQIMRQWLQERS